MNGCKKNTLENKSEIFCENNGGISACDANCGSAVQYKEIFEGLKKQAADYGVSYNDSWYTKSAQDILRGVIDNDTLTTQFKENAKSRFPTLVKQIDAGYTVQQIASPYVNSMASILELDPYAINVNDNYIQQALTGLDAEGQPTTKPLWQFERDLRKDPRWSYTKNAQETAMSTTRKILQDFGLAY